MSNTAVDSNAGGARNTRGRTPVYSPRMNGEELEVTFTAVTITLSEGTHDSASLECVSTELENTDGMLNSPISFYWGIAPRTEIFQGYVTGVTDVQGSQGNLSFKLTILGPTKVMSIGTPRFWQGKSVSAALTDVARGDGLASSGHTSDFIWRAIAQTSETDWEMVLKLADRLGWFVCYRYGVILIYDPAKLFTESGAYTNLVSNLTDTGETTDRNLIEFQATSLSDMLKEQLGTKFGCFSGTTPQVSTQEGEYPGYIFSTSRTLYGSEEAKVALAAEDSMMTSWMNIGLARIWGDADLFPGMCVNVTTVSERYLAAPNDGKWLIQSVAHHADPSSFQTNITLTRPKALKADASRVYRPFWEDAKLARPSLTLKDGSWYTNWGST